ncbi:uncharacterized protein LOC143426982 [Xylocopa sonorina]|uniref:uncharacterized protein LOC143426982 n=1 Tax=Xylocopa sonorina TaxID=1818115 RepID=UPI00403AED76
MEENIKCSENDCKQNQNLPHIFKKHEPGYQSIKEVNFHVYLHNIFLYVTNIPEFVPLNVNYLLQNDTMYMIAKEQDYFDERNIFDTFHFLLCHLVVDQPTDPIQYLYRLLDDCILFRSGLKNPPLFWREKYLYIQMYTYSICYDFYAFHFVFTVRVRHVDAIFKSVAPFDSELLSLDGYKTAMKVLGVRFCDPCPAQLVSGHIDQRTFCTEALNNMKEELMRIVNGTN